MRGITCALAVVGTLAAAQASVQGADTVDRNLDRVVLVADDKPVSANVRG